MPDRPTNGFSAEANALDAELDIRLGEIRAMQDSHAVTVREAADMRVEALERHLVRVWRLRSEYFGE